MALANQKNGHEAGQQGLNILGCWTGWGGRSDDEMQVWLLVAQGHDVVGRRYKRYKTGCG